MKYTVPTIFSAIDKFSTPVDKMTRTAESRFSRLERRVDRYSEKMFRNSRRNALIATSIAIPLIAAGQQAVKFEDKLADVSKTTGIEDEALKDFGKSILNLSKDTRTGIDDLLKISEIGGQLGIAEDEILSFTDAADKFNIALGSDFNSVEEAVAQVGKIKALFKDTKGMDISDVINKVGSSINFIGAEGNATSANLTDFTLRIGALPDAMKPSVTDAIALGAALEEVGVNSQIGSSGLTRLILTAGKDISGFAKQMDITKVEAEKLFRTDPTAFVKKFSSSFQGLEGDEISKTLAGLKLNSNEVIKVVGGLGSSTERLTKLQEWSNEAFTKGNSLQKEAATKNETTAGKLGMLKNQAQGVAISLGNALLPVAISLGNALVPIIEKVSAWIERNPELTGTLTKLAVGLAIGYAAISGLQLAFGAMAKITKIAKVGLAAYNLVIGISGALSSTASIAIGKSRIALIAYNATTKIVTAAQWLWNAAMMANPIGLIIAGVAVLGAAIYGLSKAFDTSTTSERLNAEVKNRALENTRDQRVEIGYLFEVLRTAEEGTKQYTSALERIEEISPGLIDKYQLQAKSLQQINAAEKELTASIMKRAKVEAAQELAKEKLKAAAENREDQYGGFMNFMSSAATFGIGDDLNTIQNKEADQLEREAEMLIRQSVEQQIENEKPVNVQATEQENTNTLFQEMRQMLTIDFKNMPTGVEVEGDVDALNVTPLSGTD